MTKLIFLWYLLTGTIEHQEKNYYIIHLKDDKIIEYASKKEAINWIKTKEFKYY